MDRFDTFRKPEEESNQDIKALVELEHDHVLQVLKKTGWRIEGVNGAAILLGLNPSTLRARMRKYGISRQ
jgi:transcriptional regulator with GAF, ATPase, and Fis domain